jgi:hypothetical protein
MKTYTALYFCFLGSLILHAQVISKDIPDPSGSCFGNWVHFDNHFKQDVNVTYLEQADHANGVSKTVRINAGGDSVIGCKQSRDGQGISPFRTYTIQSVKDLNGKLLSGADPGSAYPPVHSTVPPPPLPPPDDQAWPPRWFDANNRNTGSYIRPLPGFNGSFSVGKICHVSMEIIVPGSKRVGESVAVQFNMGPSGLSGTYANMFSSGQVDWGDKSPSTGFDLVNSDYKPYQRLASYNQVREHVYKAPGTYHISAFMGGDYKDTIIGSWRCNAQHWEDITISK